MHKTVNKFINSYMFMMICEKKFWCVLLSFLSLYSFCSVSIKCVLCLFCFCQMQNKQMLGTQSDSICHFEMPNICCLQIIFAPRFLRALDPVRMANRRREANFHSFFLSWLTNDQAHKFMFCPAKTECNDLNNFRQCSLFRWVRFIQIEFVCIRVRWR